MLDATPRMLGERAVAHGWVTESRVREALSEQAAAIRERRYARLGEILVHRQLLTSEQVTALLAEQGVTLSHCRRCGTQFNMVNADGGLTYLCPRDGDSLAPGCRASFGGGSGPQASTVDVFRVRAHGTMHRLMGLAPADLKRLAGDGAEGLMMRAIAADGRVSGPQDQTAAPTVQRAPMGARGGVVARAPAAAHAAPSRQVAPARAPGGATPLASSAYRASIARQVAPQGAPGRVYPQQTQPGGPAQLGRRAAPPPLRNRPSPPGAPSTGLPPVSDSRNRPVRSAVPGPQAPVARRPSPRPQQQPSDVAISPAGPVLSESAAGPHTSFVPNPNQRAVGRPRPPSSDLIPGTPHSDVVDPALLAGSEEFWATTVADGAVSPSRPGASGATPRRAASGAELDSAPEVPVEAYSGESAIHGGLGGPSSVEGAPAYGPDEPLVLADFPFDSVELGSEVDAWLGDGAAPGAGGAQPGGRRASNEAIELDVDFGFDLGEDSAGA